MSSQRSIRASSTSVAWRRPASLPPWPGRPTARPPSPAQLAAAETRLLTAWAAALCRHRGLLLSQLGSLSPNDVALEIAGYQWELVLETASHVYHLTEKREGEIARLAASPAPLDRYAAAVVRRWDREKRAR